MAQLRKDRMTKNERIVALLNRQPVDRIPVLEWSFGFSTVYQGLSIADFYNNPQKNFNAVTQTAQEFGWMDSPFMVYAAVGAWEFGGEIKWPSGEFTQAPMVTRYPVTTEEDMLKLKAPDPKTAGILPLAMEVSKLVEKSSEAYIWVWVIEGVFTAAANICGVAQFCKWMLKKPELAHRLMRLATDLGIEWARYNVDTFSPERLIACVGEPSASNQVISPKQFEQFAFPYIKELHEKMLAMGYKHIICHICGEQNENYPYWAQVPMGDPGIISVSQEVDLEKAMDYFPNDIIMGNVEPAVIQTGTPEQVYELSRICIEKGRKHPGGFILGPGCELPPMAPPENMWAMMQAVSDFGWYE
jgi:uroporphyrinogen decarboxylase